MRLIPTIALVVMCTAGCGDDEQNPVSSVGDRGVAPAVNAVAATWDMRVKGLSASKLINNAGGGDLTAEIALGMAGAHEVDFNNDGVVGTVRVRSEGLWGIGRRLWNFDGASGQGLRFTIDYEWTPFAGNIVFDYGDHQKETTTLTMETVAGTAGFHRITVRSPKVPKSEYESSVADSAYIIGIDRVRMTATAQNDTPFDGQTLYREFELRPGRAQLYNPDVTGAPLKPWDNPGGPWSEAEYNVALSLPIAVAPRLRARAVPDSVLREGTTKIVITPSGGLWDRLKYTLNDDRGYKKESTGHVVGSTPHVVSYTPVGEESSLTKTIRISVLASGGLTNARAGSTAMREDAATVRIKVVDRKENPYTLTIVDANGRALGNQTEIEYGVPVTFGYVITHPDSTTVSPASDDSLLVWSWTGGGGFTDSTATTVTVTATRYGHQYLNLDAGIDEGRYQYWRFGEQKSINVISRPEPTPVSVPTQSPTNSNGLSGSCSGNKVWIATATTETHNFWRVNCTLTMSGPEFNGTVRLSADNDNSPDAPPNSYNGGYYYKDVSVTKAAGSGFSQQIVGVPSVWRRISRGQPNISVRVQILD